MSLLGKVYQPPARMTHFTLGLVDTISQSSLWSTHQRHPRGPNREGENPMNRLRKPDRKDLAVLTATTLIFLLLLVISARIP